MGIMSTYPTIAGQHALTHQPGGEDPVVGVPPGAHAVTHILAGADAIIAGLDARALNLAAQGEIVFHAAAANTLVALAVGAAGQALLSGGPAANVLWGAPAPAAHEATHVAGGVDDIDSALDARAIALTAQGEIVYHAAAANTLAVLAVGVAGQALLTGGPAANPSWGAPAPAAHEATHVAGGADDIDSALDGRAITLTTQGDLVYASGANTLARLAAGTAGQTLQTGGGGANPSWTWNKRLDSAPDATDTGNGITAFHTLGENVLAGDVLYKKADGKYWKADASSAAEMPAVLLALADGAADAVVELLRVGYYREDSRWNWTVGNGEANLLFVHTTAGDMVQLANQPAGAGDQVQVVGHVETADVIYWNPSYELIEVS